MAYQAIMKMEEKEYEILYSRFEVHQTLDDAGNITSPKQWAHLYLELIFVKEDLLLNWATSPESPKDLEIRQYRDSTAPFKSLLLKKAYCAAYQEKFNKGARGMSAFRSETSYNFIICLTITAAMMEVKEAQLSNF